MIRILTIATLSAFIASGCTNTASVSHTETDLISVTSGITDIALDSNTYRVNFTGEAKNNAVTVEERVYQYTAQLADQKGFDAFVVLDSDRLVDPILTTSSDNIAINREVPTDQQCTMTGCQPVAEPMPPEEVTYYSLDETKQSVVHFSIVARLGHAEQFAQTGAPFIEVQTLFEGVTGDFDKTAAR